MSDARGRVEESVQYCSDRRSFVKDRIMKAPLTLAVLLYVVMDTSVHLYYMSIESITHFFGKDDQVTYYEHSC